MPIPQINLDDLAWTDLTAATRARIPAASNGTWTLHAPVDPGVTLLELHAWLLEQRLYWMNQTPDALTRGALTLLGDAPLDARCAATVLSLSSADQPSALVRVPAGTQLTLQDSDPPLIFSLEQPVTLLPLPADGSGISLWIGGRELQLAQDVCLFAGATQPDEIELRLGLTAALPKPASSDRLGLAVVVDPTGDAVPAEWSIDAVDGVAPPATLSWWYETAGGQRARFAADAVQDGTGGMRRSGIVRLGIPTDWSASEGASHVYRLWIRAETSGFAAPPRLSALWPNAAIARHRRTLRGRPAVDWLPHPGNTIALGTGVLTRADGSAYELDGAIDKPRFAGTRLRLRERDDKWHWWTPTADLTFNGRADRVFAIDRDMPALRFGTGETGRVPLPGWFFTLRDLGDALGLARAWQDAHDPLAAFLRGRLPAAGLAVVSGVAAASSTIAPSRALLRALLEGLNAAVGAADLYDPARFAAVTLDPTTQALVTLGPAPGSDAHRRLNRQLLENAYAAFVRAGPVELALDVGGGNAGNVGALRPWESLRDASTPATAPTLLAVNIVAASDGADPEAMADARQRAAASLHQADRAVIADDFVTLTRTTPGLAIARAHAAVGYHPAFPCLPVPGAVTVFVVPDAPRDGAADQACARTIAPEPDPSALAAVARRLDAARLIGTEIYVRPPVYRPVAVTVDIEGNPGSPDTLRRDVTDRLRDFLDPLIGGDGGDGWPFGAPLRPSALLREAELAVADRADVTGVGIRRLDVVGAIDETCRDVDIGVHALPALETINIRIAAASGPTAGGLQ
jgi:hypothetical protein